MSNSLKIILGVIGFTIIIALIAVVISGNDHSVNPKEQGVANLKIDRLQADLGKMKVSEEKSAVFTITNTGNSVLRVWNVATSCDCTFATFTINGQTTAEFNMPMHMNSSLRNWLGEIPVGQKAVLKVIYRPSVMPVQGPVTRDVTFSTNDPNNSNIDVAVSANVI